jgi:hypothetical protein
MSVEIKSSREQWMRMIELPVDLAPILVIAWRTIC